MMFSCMWSFALPFVPLMMPHPVFSLSMTSFHFSLPTLLMATYILITTSYKGLVVFSCYQVVVRDLPGFICCNGVHGVFCLIHSDCECLSFLSQVQSLLLVLFILHSANELCSLTF